MIAVAALNLMGVRMYSPPYARQIGPGDSRLGGVALFHAAGRRRAGGQLAGNPGGDDSGVHRRYPRRADFEPRLRGRLEIDVLRLHSRRRDGDGGAG